MLVFFGQPQQQQQQRWESICSKTNTRQKNTLALTTFCNPSMRLLTTTRRPLSSWNMVLSSSQERSHMSGPTSSVFWPITFVVMEGLTSTISVLSLTMFAWSVEAERGPEWALKGWWLIRDVLAKTKKGSDFQWFYGHTKGHEVISLTLGIKETFSMDLQAWSDHIEDD